MKASKLFTAMLVLIFSFSFISCDPEDDDTTKFQSTKKISGKTINLNGGSSTNDVPGPPPRPPLATKTREVKNGFPRNGGGRFVVFSQGDKSVKILKEGEVFDSFKIPQFTKVSDLGDEPLVVDSDLSIAAYSVGFEPAAPAYHFHLNDSNLYYGDGGATQADTVVTGIKIARGNTLTLPLNTDVEDAACYDQAGMMLINDLVINGTLTVANLTTGALCDTNPEARHAGDANERDSGALWTESYRVYIGDKGRIDTSGDDAIVVDTRGGDGGSLLVWGATLLDSDGKILANGGNGLGTGVGGDAAMAASSVHGGVGIETWMGPLSNTGKVDSSGGDGLDGGLGAPVYLLSQESFVYNSGTIDANGGAGNAATGIGGEANMIGLWTGSATLYNKGTLLSNGGAGGLGGGNGNMVNLSGGYFYSYCAFYCYGRNYSGNAFNTGNVKVNGGDALLSGNGGNAGAFFSGAISGELHTTGRIEGAGGDGAGAYGYGGNGAYVRIHNSSEYSYDFSYGLYYPYYYFDIIDGPGNTVISNDIFAPGGNGAIGGGHGGMVYSYAIALPRRVGYGYGTSINVMPNFDTGYTKLVGFDQILLNGGNASSWAGRGGNIRLGASGVYASSWGITQSVMEPGPLTNNVPISANGGNASNGFGGSGGYTFMGGYGYIGDKKHPGHFYGAGDITNNAKIEINGGNSGDYYGGRGGYFGLGGNRVINDGSIFAKGGNGTSAGVEGGYGGKVLMFGTGQVINNNILSTNGGDGTTGGSGGGDIFLRSDKRVINSGNLKSKGGDGPLAGGHGGYIALDSKNSRSKNPGTENVKGGADTTDGSDNGENGVILLDGADVTPKDGTLP